MWECNDTTEAPATTVNVTVGPVGPDETPVTPVISNGVETDNSF